MLSTHAYACFCFSTPLCSQIGAVSQSSVFIGRVIEVWPNRQTIATESVHLSPRQYRQLILKRWQGNLSPEEETYVRTSPNRDKIEFRLGIMQRVRFQVSEELSGPKVSEVYTDASSCGFPFEPGQVYLVNATRDGSRYRTAACFRTAKIDSDSAIEDLKALRARKSGKRLPPRIYGRIYSSDLTSNTRLRLALNGEERSVVIGDDGRFSIDGLERLKYRLIVEDERGIGDREIDLSRIGCFESFPWFSSGWHIAGSPIVIYGQPVPRLHDAPPLPLGSNRR
jgi:hypothetical protein